jgi:hypothetical protein
MLMLQHSHGELLAVQDHAKSGLRWKLGAAAG